MSWHGTPSIGKNASKLIIDALLSHTGTVITYDDMQVCLQLSGRAIPNKKKMYNILVGVRKWYPEIVIANIRGEGYVCVKRKTHAEEG